MKKNLSLMVILGLLVVGLLYILDRQGEVPSLYKAGKYIGIAEGYNGPIKVEVTTTPSKIEDIKVLENTETKGIGDQALAKIPKAIVATQNINVDGIGGATYSSTGVKNAVLNALGKAGAKIEGLMKGATVKAPAEPTKPTEPAEEPKVYKDETTDVVVVGGGGAGLTASIAAKEKGANVILLEKMPFLGGNTIYATGGINAAGTEMQKKDGIEDTPELFYDDTMKGGKNRNNPALLKTLTEKAKDMIPWLQERGMDISRVSMSGGASVKRIHQPTGGAAIGPILVKALGDKAKELGVDIRTENKVTKLLKAKGKVVGVEVDNKGNTYRIYSKSVVMATGGFGNNPEMIVKYKPELEGFGSTNSPSATGEGIQMIEKAGGQLVDMDQIQTHPTVVYKNTAMITEAVRGEGAILANREGKRFISEMETRDVVSKAILDQTGKSAFLVFDQNVRKAQKSIEGYIKKGFTTEGATIEELAKKVGINETELANTIKKVNEYVKAKEDKEFGNKALTKELVEGPFYAIEVAPAIHHTMGGVVIDTNAEVLDASGTAIPGLFAAGEVTGGIHGANRIGGNAVADIEVFGKIAGDDAADYSKGIVSSMDDESKAKQEQTFKDLLKDSGISVQRNGEQLNLAIPGGASFDSDSAVIKDNFKASLDAIATIFASYPNTIIFITGYTDSTGDAAHNRQLSLDRAESVKTYLVSKGVDASRINTAGYGPANPVATNDTEEGKAKNRRVELNIFSTF